MLFLGNIIWRRAIIIFSDRYITQHWNLIQNEYLIQNPVTNGKVSVLSLGFGSISLPVIADIGRTLFLLWY